VSIKIFCFSIILLIFQACSLGPGEGSILAEEYFQPHSNDYITINSSSHSSLNNLKKGFFHYQKGEYQLALDQFNKSNTVGNPRLKLYMGNAHYALKNYPEAEKLFEELIVVNSFSYTDITYWHLALTYLQQEKIPAAEAIFQAFATREVGSYRQSDSSEILKKLESN